MPGGGFDVFMDMVKTIHFNEGEISGQPKAIPIVATMAVNALGTR